MPPPGISFAAISGRHPRFRHKPPGLASGKPEDRLVARRKTGTTRDQRYPTSG